MLHIFFGWLIPINRIWFLWVVIGPRSPKFYKKVFPRHMMFQSKVELPIIPRLQQLGVRSLGALQGVDIFKPLGHNLQSRGDTLMNLLGLAFRLWCKHKKIEKPPATWNLHLIGRGSSDSANAYPTLDSNVKAAHVKPILFFLAEISSEISSHCTCPLAVNHM